MNVLVVVLEIAVQAFCMIPMLFETIWDDGCNQRQKIIVDVKERNLTVFKWFPVVSSEFLPLSQLETFFVCIA